MAAPKSRRSTATSAARKAATGAASRAAKGAAKGAARTAAKGAAKGAAKTVAASGDRIGRGTRWTEEQVTLLLETVTSSPTAKEAFEKVAKQLDKSAGTVAQKYYNIQKANGGGRSGGNGGARRGRPAGSGAGARGGAARGGGRAAGGAGGGALPDAAELRVLAVDDLTGLAMRVKAEIDRRRTELDAASKALAG